MAKNITIPLEEITSGVLPPLPVELPQEIAVTVQPATGKPVEVALPQAQTPPNKLESVVGLIVLIISMILTRIAHK